MQPVDIPQHATDACANQIVVVDHQHPNQADTSLIVLKAGWLLAFQERTLPKKTIWLADRQAKQLIEIIRRFSPADELLTEHRRMVAVSGLVITSIQAVPTPAMPTLIAALVLTFTHLLAGRLDELHQLPRSRWLSVAGGVAVAYVFVHLLPELAHGQRVIEDSGFHPLRYLEHHAYLLALIGLSCFYGLERLIKAHRSDLPDDADTHASMFWLHIGAFAGYNALIGYILANRGADRPVELIWYTVAMSLHFLVNDVALQSDHQRLFVRRGRWILAASALVGCGTGLLTELSELAVSAVTAFVAGAIVLNVLKEELPTERNSRFGAFLAGALGYSALLLLL